MTFALSVERLPSDLAPTLLSLTLLLIAMSALCMMRRPSLMRIRKGHGSQKATWEEGYDALLVQFTQFSSSMLNLLYIMYLNVSYIYLTGTLLDDLCLTDGMFDVSVSQRYFKCRISQACVVSAVRNFDISCDVWIR
jgi:hypothetical protein